MKSFTILLLIVGSLFAKSINIVFISPSTAEDPFFNRVNSILLSASKEFGYKVINLQGGMEYATRGLHLKTVPYRP